MIVVAIVVALAQRLLSPAFVGPPTCTFTASSGATFDLSPEQARNAATIAGIATKRELPARAATIAVATAMQESKLTNLQGGDRDSVGLFQQRPSQGWGTAEQSRDPVYASDIFYDHLLKVPDWDTIPLTEAAQAVQFSGFPEAYAKHEREAQTYAEALTGVRPAAVGCRLKDTAAVSSPAAVRDTLDRETGVRADVSGSSLVLQAKDARSAATAAAWAVAGAQQFGVTEVRLGSRVWQRGTGDEALTWSDSQDGAAPTAVRITLVAS